MREVHMPREEMLPSESELMIMEVLWRCGHDLTSAEITDRLPKSSKMTQRMVRVLINRLCKKGMLTYTVDPDDSRVYHYTAAKGREECRRAKSSAFANTALSLFLSFCRGGSLFNRTSSPSSPPSGIYSGPLRRQAPSQAARDPFFC